jgi:outer membrane protein OmpA-like peptidoglycan-associated protein
MKSMLFLLTTILFAPIHIKIIAQNSEICFVTKSESRNSNVRSNLYTSDLNFKTQKTSINSELNEVGVCFFRNKFIILSNAKRRHYNRTINQFNNSFNNNIYCVDVTENLDLKYPLLFSHIIDSDLDEGSLTFTPDEKFVFFTKSNPNQPDNFSLYRAELDLSINGYWKNITLLLEGNDFSIETPHVLENGRKIIFASNKVGGYGGFDLYEATLLENGTIENIMNLGSEINSNLDEKFPYSNNNYLYFSSKGHNSFGGFDVFRISYNSNRHQYTNRINLGKNFNSNLDEIAFIPIDNKRGFFSRNDSFGAPNFNIYSYESENYLLEKTIQVVEKNTKQILPNTQIEVKNEFDDIILSGITNELGLLEIKFNPTMENTIIAIKDGYNLSENIINLNKKTVLELEQTKVEVLDDKLVIENIYFEFDKFKLLEESKLTLNKIVNYLKENPGVSIEIHAHTDTKGSESYNKQLSLNRGRSTYEYLIENGIEKTRITYYGHGMENPVIHCNNNCSDKDNETNRRVEFLIIHL